MIILAAGTYIVLEGAVGHPPRSMRSYNSSRKLCSGHTCVEYEAELHTGVSMAVKPSPTGVSMAVKPSPTNTFLDPKMNIFGSQNHFANLTDPKVAVFRLACSDIVFGTASTGKKRVQFQNKSYTKKASGFGFPYAVRGNKRTN